MTPRRHDPATSANGTRVALPASTDGDGVFLVLNPSSGRSVWRPDPSDYLAEHLPAATLRRLADGEDPVDAVRRAFSAPQPPTVLGVCGGDGTVATVAHLAREFDVPLLVIPGGTFNHFARAAGLDTVDDAVRALQAGDGVRADVAELRVDGSDPMTVLNAVSLGVYPAFVEERERLGRYLGKWLGGLAAATLVLRTAEPIDVTVRGRSMRVWSLFVGVNRNHRATVAPMQRLHLDDGVLDMRILHAVARQHAIAALAFGRRTSVVLRALRLLPAAAAQARIMGEVSLVARPPSGAPAQLAHDGEVLEGGRETTADAEPGVSASGGRELNAIVRILPGALRLYSPRESDPRGSHHDG